MPPNYGLAWVVGLVASFPADTSSSVCAIGDITGDSIDDVLFSGRAEVGGIWVLDEADGRSLLRVEEKNGISYGGAMGSVGDVNGDEVPDFAFVESSGSRSTGDEIHVYSGRSLSINLRIPLPVGVSNLAGGMDSDADGVSDIVVATYDRNGRKRGVRVLSGRTGATILTVSPAEAQGPVYSIRVATIADVDGDERRDFALLMAGKPGRLHAHSSVSGDLIYSARGPEPADPMNTWGRFFGWSLLELPDLDGDSHSELWVTALDDAMVVLSGKDGATLREVSMRSIRDRYKREKFGEGSTAALVGDCDGDGSVDVVMGCRELVTCSRAYVSLISSKTLGVLRRVEAKDVMGEAACDCSSGSVGVDVASVNRLGKALFVMAGPTCGSIGLFRASSNGFERIWQRELR